MSKLIYQTFLSLLWRFEFNIHKISHYITWWKVIHGLWLFSMFPWWHAFLIYFYPPTAFGKMAYYFVTMILLSSWSNPERKLSYFPRILNSQRWDMKMKRSTMKLSIHCLIWFKLIAMRLLGAGDQHIQIWVLSEQ